MSLKHLYILYSAKFFEGQVFRGLVILKLFAEINFADQGFLMATPFLGVVDSCSYAACSATRFPRPISGFCFGVNFLVYGPLFGVCWS